MNKRNKKLGDDFVNYVLSWWCWYVMILINFSLMDYLKIAIILSNYEIVKVSLYFANCHLKYVLELLNIFVQT